MPRDTIPAHIAEAIAPSVARACVRADEYLKEIEAKRAGEKTEQEQKAA